MWHTWERRENCRRFWWESQNERDLLEDRGIDGRRESEWILERLPGKIVIGFSWLRIGAGCCECSDKPLGSGITELDN
jgi:hypothetical protein